MCSNPAQVICICYHVHLCSNCTSTHITEGSVSIHTFLPIASEARFKEGDDHYSLVKIAQCIRSVKAQLLAEIDSIETFKQTSLVAIDACANRLTPIIDDVIQETLLKLTRDVEISKQKAYAFSNQLEEEHIDVAKYSTSVFFRNAFERNANFKLIETFKTAFETVEVEESLKEFASFDIKVPSEPLFEITRTPEEYKDWLVVLEQRKHEELKKKERKLSRLVGGASSWNVSGYPTLDAFSFKVNTMIWLTGIGTGNGNTTGGTCSIQDIEIRQGRSTRGDLLYRHSETVTASWDGTEDDKFFKVQFNFPVQLLKDTDYCVRVCYNAGGNIWSANGTITTTVDDTVFTFQGASFDGGDNDNASSASSGPTRDLYFALAKCTL